jgi:hypothetical protein
MSFFTDVIQRDPRFTSTQAIRDLALLEPVTRAAVDKIIAAAAARGITIFVTETYRSAERQQMLFAQGATQLKDVGVHHYGLACDFAKQIDGKASWAGDWSFLRDVANLNGMISGLDWGLPHKVHTFVDPDHVQRVAQGDQNRLFIQGWYPSDAYTPGQPGGA